MKAITAYIQPFMLEKVADALRNRKIHGVTTIPCEGFGRKTEGRSPHYKDAAAELGYAPKIKIEIVCRDEETPSIVQTIRDHAHTGHTGDGIIFVAEVLSATAIRSGTEGESIL